MLLIYDFSSLNNQLMSKPSTPLSQKVSDPPKSKLRIFGRLLIVFLLIGIVGLSAVWHFGSHQNHKEKHHVLYTSFDQSPEHKKLLTQLQKNKYSILLGKKQDGLIQFVEHYANKLSQANRTIFIQDYNKEHSQLYQVVRQAKVQISQLLGQETTGDWIIFSQNGTAIPGQIIANIQLNNPEGKLLIVTTTKQKVNGFKEFVFLGIKQNLLEKSIAKSFKVKPQVADILYDYFETPEKIYSSLVLQKFDPKQFLGQNHRTLEGLDKEDKTLLQTLCNKGVSKSKKQRSNLAVLGVIHYEGSNYWQNVENILNYELNAGVNCKNIVATELILKSAQSKKQKGEEERKIKEEEQKRKVQERKAQEERNAEEAKLLEERKKQEQQQKKKKLEEEQQKKLVGQQQNLKASKKKPAKTEKKALQVQKSAPKKIQKPVKVEKVAPPEPPKQKSAKNKK